MEWSRSEIASLIGMTTIFVIGMLMVRYPDQFNSAVMREAPRSIRLFICWLYLIFAGAVWSIFVSNLVIMRIWSHFLGH